MCGITGVLGPLSVGEPEPALRAMTDAIAHRGPDASGVWFDAACNIGLGHRRLSIIDLSPTGAQPMHSHSGRYVLVLNGEAYNFASVRAELAAMGATFRGTSDTEVMLAAFEQWGVCDGLVRFTGMFAIAVWDRETHELWLARDRLGEKPLFYGRLGRSWVFGSEMKCLRAMPGWREQLHMPAVLQYLQHGYVQAPHSIAAGVQKVRPGTLVRLRPGDDRAEETVYWSAEQAARTGLQHPITGGPDETDALLEATLREVIRDESVADVPLGAFLSGGIDSSLVVALMQEQSRQPVRTFTIGFDDPRYNEAGFAGEVAKHLGTAHTEMMVTGDDALALVDRLPSVYDEPLADSSQLPTLLVSHLTRQHVTVALSGDGGDELFGGYSWYRQRGVLERTVRSIPREARVVLGKAAGVVGHPANDVITGLFAALQRPQSPRRSALVLSRLSAMLQAPGEQELFASALAMHTRATQLLAPAHRNTTASGALTAPWLGDAHVFESRMLRDSVSYLPDDLLVKVDRAAMAASLETRAPLLDHRVFELAWRIPHTGRVSAQEGKRPLRRLLYRRVPQALIDRPKRGFSVPLAAWLRGPLRNWAGDHLSETALTTTALLDVSQVRRLWEQHQRGAADHADVLWSLTLLQAHLLRTGARL